MADFEVEIDSHLAEVLALLEKASEQALETVGGNVESWAKALVVHPKALATELRNSITHMVEDGVLSVGSNQQVAPYIELGTGPNYEPPPEWLQNEAQGGRGMAGLKCWIYFDPLEGKFKIGTPQEARPFLRPAFMDHLDEIGKFLEAELSREDA